MVVTSGTHPMFQAARESAMRAVLQLRAVRHAAGPTHYELWKDIEINFDPRDMFGG